VECLDALNAGGLGVFIAPTTILAVACSFLSTGTQGSPRFIETTVYWYQLTNVFFFKITPYLKNFKNFIKKYDKKLHVLVSNLLYKTSKFNLV
jgi:hypothetical protein